MIRNSRHISAVALCLALAAPAVAQDTATTSEGAEAGAAAEAGTETAGGAADVNTVVATVNGTEITLGHVIAVRESLPQQYQQMPDDVLFDGIIDQLVQQTVLAQADEDGDSLRTRLGVENQQRMMRAGETVEKIAAAAVTEEAVQNAYEAAYGEGSGAMEYNASHILVETEEEAQAIVEELEGGADFAELAKEKSTGPSGPNGGELGWFGKGMMVPDFENAVTELEDGAISAPVQTQFGWHVIKLNESRQKAAPKLEEVRGQIEQQVQQQAIAEEIEKLTEAAEVTRMSTTEIDAALLRQSELLEQ